MDCGLKAEAEVTENRAPRRPVIPNQDAAGPSPMSKSRSQGCCALNTRPLFAQTILDYSPNAEVLTDRSPCHHRTGWQTGEVACTYRAATREWHSAIRWVPRAKSKATGTKGKRQEP